MHASHVASMHEARNSINTELVSVLNHSGSTPVFGAMYSKSPGNTNLFFLFVSGFLLVVFVSSKSIVVDEL
jgi:hypothetical protein